MNIKVPNTAFILIMNQKYRAVGKKNEFEGGQYQGESQRKILAKNQIGIPMIRKIFLFPLLLGFLLSTITPDRIAKIAIKI